MFCRSEFVITRYRIRPFHDKDFLLTFAVTYCSIVVSPASQCHWKEISWLIHHIIYSFKSFWLVVTSNLKSFCKGQMKNIELLKDGGFLTTLFFFYFSILEAWPVECLHHFLLWLPICSICNFYFASKTSLFDTRMTLNLKM